MTFSGLVDRGGLFRRTARARHRRFDGGEGARRLLAAVAAAEPPGRQRAADPRAQNPASTTRGGVIDVNGEPLAVEAIPALGFAVVDAAPRRNEPGVRCAGRRRA